jgi:hypothetical protein
MIEYLEERLVKLYRVRCTAEWEASPRGCSGSGPWAETESEAIYAAEDRGWCRSDKSWICPSHLETRPGGRPDGVSEIAHDYRAIHDY